MQSMGCFRLPHLRTPDYALHVVEFSRTWQPQTEGQVQNNPRPTPQACTRSGAFFAWSVPTLPEAWLVFLIAFCGPLPLLSVTVTIF